MISSAEILSSGLGPIGAASLHVDLDVSDNLTLALTHCCQPLCVPMSISLMMYSQYMILKKIIFSQKNLLPSFFFECRSFRGLGVTKSTHFTEIIHSNLQDNLKIYNI
jgi:hypothetical protein